MNPATLLPKSWQTRLAPLWGDLYGIKPTQQNEDSHTTGLFAGLLNKYLDSPASSPLRPFTIQDLPDELLLGIFRHLHNRDDIKRLRLSTQRLNKTSSHLLINTLRVYPSPKSLERLDRVSRHPIISRGVCRLVVSVDVYSPRIALDVQSFTAWSLAELLKFVTLPRGHAATAEALEIYRSWVSFVAALQDSYNDLAHLNEDHISAVHVGWLRYKQLFDEQQMVFRNGRFCNGIASAVGRMAFLNDLVIKDSSSRTAHEDPWNSPLYHKMSDLVNNPTRLVEEMMVHTFSWRNARDKGLENPPTYLLSLIPLAIHNAGSSLAHLRFDLTPPRFLKLRLNSSSWSQLGSFAQGLKSFKLSIGAQPQRRVRRTTEETSNFERFLTILTQSGELDTLTLDFAFRERHYHAANRTQDPHRTSIGPLMVDWHKHQNIHLKNCSITLEELQTFVGLPRNKPAVLGLWYVYLLDGTWAEAVEILRREVLSGQLSQQSYVRSPYGAECLTMSKVDRKRIFHYRSDRRFCKDSLVNCYIKGYDIGFASNPLRE